MELNCNGVAREVTADEGTALMYVLRNDLEMPGTRFGCGMNTCGACYVLIDGHPVASCDTPLWAAAGRRITTVEGLPADLRRAFADEQAAQCGYCVSGVMVSASALLERVADPSEAEIKAALDGHLCRCGSHLRIVAAVRRAAAVRAAAVRAAAVRAAAVRAAAAGPPAAGPTEADR